MERDHLQGRNVDGSDVLTFMLESWVSNCNELSRDRVTWQVFFFFFESVEISGTVTTENFCSPE